MKRFAVFCLSLLAATTLMLGQEAPKKFGIKSGSFTLVSEVMGQKVESKSYFDDYGNLQADRTNAFGMELTTISRDGKTYMVNPAAKQVQEMPFQESINYLDLTDEVIAKYKIKEIGHETVAGKECVKYTMEVSQMGQTAHLTVSVWQGIPMKTVTSVSGTDVATTVTDIAEEAVDASMFTVPSFE
ncbi:MAG: DUF4412 domain-containing protein [Bacteroidales bacterium]|nr:DUF4412 domain-containing protein [Bacteroidales bacterium]